MAILVLFEILLCLPFLLILINLGPNLESSVFKTVLAIGLLFLNLVNIYRVLHQTKRTKNLGFQTVLILLATIIFYWYVLATANWSLF